MLDFLIDVASKYTEAPYHTFYHAVDIVTMLYYLSHELNADKYLTNVDLSFLMVAALCHDIGHVSTYPFVDKSSKNRPSSIAWIQQYVSNQDENQLVSTIW